MKIKLSKSQWEKIGNETGWLKTAQNLPNIDQNTKLIGHFKNVTEAGKKCIEKHGRLPKVGYQMIIDEGTEPFHYKTYLENISEKLRVWTWLDSIPQYPKPNITSQSNQLKNVKPSKPQTCYYYINLDERGSFYADVRNPSGKTIFEIKAGNELKEGEISIFEDGFMKDKNDIAGLKDYLVTLGIMNKNQVLMKGN